MRFIKPDINIDIIGKRKIAFYISITIILISFLSLIIHKGPRFGVDFAGGTLVQVKFFSPANIDDIKTGLDAIGLAKSSVQTFGDKVRLHPYVHALCTRGGWNARGEWVPVPYVDTRKAEKLFRHGVFRLLKEEGLLSDDASR